MGDTRIGPWRRRSAGINFFGSETVDIEKHSHVPPPGNYIANGRRPARQFDPCQALRKPLIQFVGTGFERGDGELLSRSARTDLPASPPVSAGFRRSRHIGQPEKFHWRPAASTRDVPCGIARQDRPRPTFSTVFAACPIVVFRRCELASIDKLCVKFRELVQRFSRTG